MHSDGYGRAGNKNGSGGSVHVRVGRVRRGRTRVCQRERADDHLCEMSCAAVSEQMPEHAQGNAVGLVTGQARTLKAALEYRMGTRVPSDARILCWVVEFAAYLMNRCDTGSDGKTPPLRLHGRRHNTPILEFGEKTLYMPAKPSRGRMWERQIHPGVFVGMLNSSSEAVVVTGQGTAIKTRSTNIRRIPESEMGRGQNARNASRAMVSGWQPQCIRHSSRNGETRGDGASRPGRSANGKRKKRGSIFTEQTSKNGVSVKVVLGAST